MADFVYDKAKPRILSGEIDAAHTFKMVLLDATHTPAKATHEFYSDISADEISGSGYTTGGIALENVTITRNTVTAKFDADDVTMEEVAPDFRYAAIYDDSHASNALVCLLDPGALVSPQGYMVVVQFHANGIMTLTDG